MILKEMSVGELAKTKEKVVAWNLCQRVYKLFCDIEVVLDMAVENVLFSEVESRAGAPQGGSPPFGESCLYQR